METFFFMNFFILILLTEGKPYYNARFLFFFLWGYKIYIVCEGKFNLGRYTVFIEQFLFSFSNYKMILLCHLVQVSRSFTSIPSIFFVLLEIQFTYHAVHPFVQFSGFQCIHRIVKPSSQSENFYHSKKKTYTHSQSLPFPWKPFSHVTTNLLAV